LTNLVFFIRTRDENLTGMRTVTRKALHMLNKQRQVFKGENIVITFIISYSWQFFQNGKMSKFSHVLSLFQFHKQNKGGLLITIWIQDYVWAYAGNLA